VLTLLGSTLAAAAACGGGSDTAAPSPKAGATTTQAAPATITAAGSPLPQGVSQRAGGKPGTLWITSRPIVGQNGKILLVFVTPDGGGQQLARACVRVTSDSFSVPATAMTDVPSGNDPCGGSTPQTVLPKGRYELRAGIYAPPATQPEKESNRTLEIGGDVALEVELGGLSK
jgi:hypothetical protein